MKICMIADDSPVIRKVARRIIEDMGFVVVEAEDGEHAIQLCRHNRPDVVMVDWDMPGMNGVEFIQALRALEEEEGTDPDHLARIIYCTSEMMVSEMTKAKRAGAKSFMMKPFNRRVLEEKFIEIGALNPDFASA